MPPASKQNFQIRHKCAVELAFTIASTMPEQEKDSNREACICIFANATAALVLFPKPVSDVSANNLLRTYTSAASARRPMKRPELLLQKTEEAQLGSPVAALGGLG